MSSNSPLAWPVLDLIEQELSEAAPAAACARADAGPIDTDALYVADCEVFLARDGADGFTLTLKHRGKISEVRLTAGVDPGGQAKLLALVR